MGPATIIFYEQYLIDIAIYVIKDIMGIHNKANNEKHNDYKIYYKVNYDKNRLEYNMSRV
jgi:hypothetical protein